MAPAPEETPKARAKGKATIAAVKPPKISPRRFRKCKVLTRRISVYLFGKITILFVKSPREIIDLVPLFPQT